MWLLWLVRVTCAQDAQDRWFFPGAAGNVRCWRVHSFVTSLHMSTVGINAGEPEMRHPTALLSPSGIGLGGREGIAMLIDCRLRDGVHCFIKLLNFDFANRIETICCFALPSAPADTLLISLQSGSGHVNFRFCNSRACNGCTSAVAKHETQSFWAQSNDPTLKLLKFEYPARTRLGTLGQGNL